MPARRLLPLAASLVAFALPSVAGATVPSAPTTPAPSYVPGKVIVEWSAGAGHGAKVTAREEAEVAYESDLGDPAFQLVAVEAGQSVAGAIEELEEDPAVSVAERDAYAAPTALPDDPLFGEQWALQNLGTGIDGATGAVAGDDIDAPGAWERTVGTPTTVVADIDTGYRFDSPDLGPVAWENSGEIAGNGVDDDDNGYVDDIHGWDFVGNDSEAPTEDANPTDEDLATGGHGLHTAGIIGAAGNNGVGITGVAQNVRIMPLRVCSNAPLQKASLCPISSTIAAINYAGHNGARVANLSITGTTSSTAELDAFAENPGTLYVIAAGNDAEDNELHPHYPCDFEPGSTPIKWADENIVCVAATNQADELASFSDFGPGSVDLGAPGTQILSVYPASETEIGDTFEEENLEANWRASGANGGFERTDEAPLTSWGISDSPGATPVAGSARSSTWTHPVAVPAGDGACRVTGLDSVVPAGGTASLTIFKNGVGAYGFTLLATGGSGMTSFDTGSLEGLAGSTVGLRVGYIAGSAPTAGAGVWLDDLKLSCNASLSTPPTYAFLEGTSMAAPQVSGTAALLFSAKPTASVEEVREALIEGTDPDPSLAGKTVSGGRLDAARALDWLEPPAPILTGFDPPSPAEDPDPSVLGTVAAGARVLLFEDSECRGPAVASGWADELRSPGFSVKVPAGSTATFSALVETRYNTSPCSAPISYTNSTPPPPPAPILDHTVPLSPGEDEHPLVVGTAPAESTVAIYSGVACEGTPISSGSAAELESPGIEITVADGVGDILSATETNVAGEISPCSNSLQYTAIPRDTEPPAPPVLRTSPVSPAADYNPRILGSAESESTVRIYAGAGCAHPAPIAVGTAAVLESPGFEVDVDAGATAEYSATATDAAGNTSTCSAPVSFTNTSVVGKSTVTVIMTNPLGEPRSESPTTTTAGGGACTVPKLVGKTLAKAKAALRGAGCKLGKVVEPKRRKKRSKSSLVVATSSPNSGAKTTRAVSLRMTPRRT